MRSASLYSIAIVVLGVSTAYAQTDTSTRVRVTDRMVVGGTTFGEVLRIVGSPTIASGTGTINPAVIDADGDVLEDSFTTVTTGGAYTWGAAGQFSSTLGVTGAATLSSTLSLAGAVTGSTGTFLVASPTRISTTSPALRFHESDAGTDLKYWEIVADGGVIKFRALDDALSVGNSLFELTRTSGITLGDFRFGSGVSTVRPENNGGGSLGSVPKKWFQVNAWELVVDTLVARDKIATINGDVVVAPTTTLTRDIVAADTTVYVKHNQSRTNDVWLLQGNGQMEKMTVTSNAIDCNVSGNCAVAGVDFKYTVTRGINGTGANDWAAGSAAVNEGNVGDGMIHAYSDRSAAFGGYPDLVISDTPAVYFRMDDDTSTQSFDEMESGLAATEGGTQSSGLGVGATAWSSVADPIWENTGGAGYLSVADTAGLRITGNLTLEVFGAWQRTTPRTEVIISKHYEAEYHLQVASDGTLQFCHGTSVGPTFTCVSSAAGYVPNDTSTHHYAVVRDADSSPKRILFYKDGALTDTFTYTQSVTTSTNAVVIGSNPVALSGNMFDGYLDEVAIYTYQLPADRIALHYSARQNASISKFTVGPAIVGYVRTGTGAFDLAERWGVGNLAGTFGYASSTTPVFGFAAGSVSGDWVSMDATNGYRNMYQGVTKLQAVGGNFSLTGDLSIGTSGSLRSGATAYDTTTGYWLDYNAGSPRFRIGTTSAGTSYLRWTGTALELKSNTVSISNSGISIANAVSSYTNLVAYGFDYGDAALHGLYAATSSGVHQMELAHTGSSPSLITLNAGNSSGTASSLQIQSSNGGTASRMLITAAEVFINGTQGFSGTKTAGSCVFTIIDGIVTNVTGC